MLTKNILLLAFFFSTLFSFGQRQPDVLILSGTVLGYSYDGSRSIFKDNEIEIEGSLSQVTFMVYDEDNKKVSEKTTAQGGDFYVKLPIGKKYQCVYEKENYGTSAFDVDLRDIQDPWKSAGLVLKHIEVILNKTKTEKPQDNGASFGTLTFDETSEKFVFAPTEFDQKKRLFKNDKDNTGVNLMNRSLNKNMTINVGVSAEDGSDEKVFIASEDSLERIVNQPEDPIAPYRQKLLVFENMTAEETVSEERIEALTSQIDVERNSILQDRERAVSPLDFFQLEARERLLAAAERELEIANAYIEVQDEKIEAQENTIWLLVAISVLLLGLAFVILLMFRNKKKMNILIAAKNATLNEDLSTKS